MVIDADIHVTTDSIANLRPWLAERYLYRQRYLNSDEFDRQVGGTLGKHGLSPAQHLEDMAQEGIDVQVLFPTGLLNLGSVREAELATALAHAYNEWLYEFCQVAPRAFKGVAVVALQDVRSAVREMTRAVTERGMVAVMAPSF